MTKAAWLPGLALATVLLVQAVPGVHAHGAAAPREIDTRVLLDDDGLLGYGGCGVASASGAPCIPEPEGLDVLALEAREAWLAGAPALVLRAVVQSETVHDGRGLRMAFTAGGNEHVLVIDSADGLTYTSSDVDRLDGPFDAFDGHPKAIDLWLRLDRFGLSVGDELSGIRLDGLHHGELDDLMPGGYMVNGVEVPHVPHDADPGEALAAVQPGSYRIQGPATLLTLQTDTPNVLVNGTTNVTVRINNPLAATAQSITLQVAGVPATLSSTNLTLDAGATRQVTLQIPALPAASQLTLIAASDLGGRDVLDFTLLTPPPAAPDPAPSDGATDPKETPLPGPALLVAALAALALVRRRQA